MIDDDLLDYDKGKRDYILARLLVVKKYVITNQLDDALDCIDNIYHDIETDYGNELK